MCEKRRKGEKLEGRDEREGALYYVCDTRAQAVRWYLAHLVGRK